MHNSTIPYRVKFLTPKRFINLLSENKVQLVEPSNDLITKTIHSIIITDTLNKKQNKIFCFSKN